MPTRISQELNVVVRDVWTAVDANANSFLAVSITQNAYGAEIYGVDFGAAGASQADEATILTRGILVEGIALDPARAAIFQVPAGARVRFQDLPSNVEKSRVHKFTGPIKIEAGINFTLIFWTTQINGAIAGTIEVYLNLRGRLLTQQADSFLRT